MAPQPAVLRSAPLLYSCARDSSLAIIGPSALPSPFFSRPPDYCLSLLCQPCPFHIWHMATLGLMLAQLRTCTLRTTLHHNIPLLIHQQPSLASTSLPQVPSHAPLAPLQARPKYSLDRAFSTGRHFQTGASGYVGSGYVRGVFQLFFCSY